jgi:hypothetical protein
MYQIKEQGNYIINIVSTMDHAYLKVIELYLANYNVYYTLDPKAHGFKYDSLLDLKDINQLIIDKKYEEAANIILIKYQQIKIVHMNDGKIPEPLDQSVISDAIKECVFNGFNTSQMGFGVGGPGSSWIGTPIIKVITKSKRKK